MRMEKKNSIKKTWETIERETEQRAIEDLKKGLCEGILEAETTEEVIRTIIKVMDKKDCAKGIEICSEIAAYYEIANIRLGKSNPEKNFAYHYGRIDGAAEVARHFLSRVMERRKFELIAADDMEILKYIYENARAFGTELVPKFGKKVYAKLRRFEKDGYINVHRIQNNNIYSLTMKGDRCIENVIDKENAGIVTTQKKKV